jgi:hypothetical protein
MDCVSVSTDFVMKESPAVSCNSSAYKQLYPLFSVLLYGVVVGAPVILLVLLWLYHGRRLQLDWRGNALSQMQSQTALGSGALGVISASRQSMLAILCETFKPRYWCVLPYRTTRRSVHGRCAGSTNPCCWPGAR